LTALLCGTTHLVRKVLSRAPFRPASIEDAYVLEAKHIKDKGNRSGCEPQATVRHYPRIAWHATSFHEVSKVGNGFEGAIALEQSTRWKVYSAGDMSTASGPLRLAKKVFSGPRV
jgi:hypothetical protein